MRIENYRSKINSATTIVEIVKENILEIAWEEDPNVFCSSRFMLPLIQEEAEYSIKNLHLKTQDQCFYIQKINQVFGEYAEA